MEADFAGFADREDQQFIEQEDPIDIEAEARSSLKMLKRVEEQFVEYFMDKIGPSRKTEKNREKVFSTLTKILDSKYGESTN